MCTNCAIYPTDKCNHSATGTIYPCHIFPTGYTVPPRSPNKNLPPYEGVLDPHLIYGSLDSPNAPLQTASGLSQPFWTLSVSCLEAYETGLDINATKLKQ